MDNAACRHTPEETRYIGFGAENGEDLRIERCACGAERQVIVYCGGRTNESGMTETRGEWK